MNSLFHALFEDTHVNQGLCQEGERDLLCPLAISWMAWMHHSATANPCYCLEGNPVPCSFPPPNPDSIPSCSWGKERTQGDVQPQRGCFFHRGAAWSCWMLLATFPGSCNSASLADRLTDTQVAKSASITLSYHGEILCFAKVYPDCLGNILLWKVPSDIRCLSPFWNKHIPSSWWTDPSKNLEIPFQKAFLYLKLLLCLLT